MKNETIGPLTGIEPTALQIRCSALTNFVTDSSCRALTTSSCICIYCTKVMPWYGFMGKYQDFWTSHSIDDSPYVFVALCIVVIVGSLIKIAASNGNIECEYFAVGYRAPDPSFL